MPSYCLKCGENTKSIVLQISRAINNGIIILSKCTVCGNKKRKLIKKPVANGILNNLVIKKLLSKILILRDILFWVQLYKMNDMINKFLLKGDKFMPEMHLKQPGYTYSACGSFTKNKQRIQKFKETGDTKYVYRN